MYGKAFFSIGKREAILVPKSAVVEMSGITGVYIVSVTGAPSSRWSSSARSAEISWK